MSKRGWPHVDSPEAVGRRLKESRLKAGLSQRELAFPGCTAVYICRIEQGDRVPSLQVVRELSRRLGVDEDWLATGTARFDRGDVLLEADLALRLDQSELAEHLYTQALEAATRPDERAGALAGLGQIDFHAGRVEDAIERLEEAQQLLDADAIEHAAIAETLGRAYFMRGDQEAAIAVLDHALEVASRGGDEREEARFAVLLANALIDSGDLTAARGLLGKTLSNVGQETDPILQARLYWSQSRLHSTEGNHELAARYARRALAAIEMTEHVAYAARAHHLLAYVELERGNAEEALDLLDRGFPLVLRTADAQMHGLFRLEKARALAKLDRSEEAASLAMEASRDLQELSKTDAGRAYAVTAEIFEGLGDRARALELYELAVEFLDERAPTYLVDIYSKMAALLEQDGRKDEALELLKRAVGLRTQVRDNS
jgi:tetratricopeptide (TPR) repeat protein